jgi:hypothetical protein
MSYWMLAFSILVSFICGVIAGYWKRGRDETPEMTETELALRSPMQLRKGW